MEGREHERSKLRLLAGMVDRNVAPAQSLWKARALRLCLKATTSPILRTPYQA